MQCGSSRRQAGLYGFNVRHKLGQNGLESLTIRQESTVCYSGIPTLFVRLDAVQREKYTPTCPAPDSVRAASPVTKPQYTCHTTGDFVRHRIAFYKAKTQYDGERRLEHRRRRANARASWMRRDGVMWYGVVCYGMWSKEDRMGNVIFEKK